MFKLPIKSSLNELEQQILEYGALGDRLKREGDGVQFSANSSSSFKTPVEELYTEDVKKLEAEIEDRINRLSITIKEQISQSNPSGQTYVQLKNSKQKLEGIASEYKQLKRATTDTWNRIQLLGGYPQQRNDGEVSAAMDDLMRERGHIYESDRVTDEIMDQAIEVQAALTKQQNSISGTREKLSVFGGILKGTSGVIAKIKFQKKKKMIILSVVIALCMMFLFIWCVM